MRFGLGELSTGGVLEADFCTFFPHFGRNKSTLVYI
jgi:hypothetical protein